MTLKMTPSIVVQPPTRSLGWRKTLSGLVAMAGIAALVALSPSPARAADPAKGGVANLAMTGEPQSLDPMQSTADLVGTIMQHVFETLYSFDANWQIQPMLASAQPKVANDGLTVTIPLRKGVKFHNDKVMTADDVLASLNRWMQMTPRGKAVAANLETLTVTAAGEIEFKFKTPYAPLLAQLALPSGMAAIMPREVIAAPLTQFIGSGPYRLKERLADKYTILTRFDGYSARSESPSGYAGKRVALLDELRFVPVANADTRVEGVLSGQFQYGDFLPVESVGKIEKAAPAVMPILTENFGFPYIVVNAKEGILATVPMRRAMKTAVSEKEMLKGAFGEDRFFVAQGNFFPKNTPYYSTAGVAAYDINNPSLAKTMADKAGYKGEPIRIMVSRQYEFHYTMALVFAEQLKRAGFAVDIQTVDWATLVQRRNDPKLWDVFFTHSPTLPEPMLSPPQLGDGAPGGWDSAAKKETIAAFNRETNLSKRAALWGKVQQLVYDEVPFIEVGKYNALSARSAKLDNYKPSSWPFFWNVSLKP